MPHRLSWILALTLTGCLGTLGGEDEVQTYNASSSGGVQAICSAQVSQVGTVDVEKDYIPRVITCEHGGAPDEALKALAVVARTFLYFKINKYGSIGDGQSDQVYTCSRAPEARHMAAAQATAGQVLLYAGKPICAFHVAGSKGNPAQSCRGTPGASSTEKYITYNEGQSGNSIQQSSIGWISSTNTANRGCFSQLGSDCLSNAGYTYDQIIRYYYGADIQLVTASGSCAGGPPPAPGPGTPAPTPPSQPPPSSLASQCQGYKWISTCQGQTTLLQCNFASQTALLVTCPAGCQANPVGTPDTCKAASPTPPPPPGGVSWSCSKSSYQGQQIWTCSGDSRYRCTGTQPVQETCARGCFVNALGKDDLCIAAAPSWTCGKSSYQGQQIWTCSGGALYRCDGQGPVAVQCPAGCNYNPLGTHDTCK